ncbi:hypothetical protein CIHG_08745 [Coccidioides immitis H538.4]|uniref:Uncharacterized protein n=3 Tax=Coccidioides immitis TaxID=5501 RepID=A0A0J8R193_COCIT|nr:hypothetical protein CIRG_02689 [Coccidioides immitis RMSCC 2394]KMU77443.1 hypothetical protein CISG_06690 [Coccidioides immitis RMSCC 3703]KMU90784.1 hypothetical protein CIHG_08745 [Coccidioides immitis H538.4]
MKEAGPVHCGNRNRVPFGSLVRLDSLLVHNDAKRWLSPAIVGGLPRTVPLAVPWAYQYDDAGSSTRLCCHVVSPDAVKRPFLVNAVDNRVAAEALRNLFPSTGIPNAHDHAQRNARSVSLTGIGPAFSTMSQYFGLLGFIVEMPLNAT